MLEIDAEEYSSVRVILHAQVTSSQTVASLALNSHTVSAASVFWSVCSTSIHCAKFDLTLA